MTKASALTARGSSLANTNGGLPAFLCPSKKKQISLTYVQNSLVFSALALHF